MSVNAILAAGLALVAITLTPDAASAYIGPGAGLGMIGSLVAVVGAVLLAIVGLLVLPFRMLAKRRRDAAAAKSAPAAGQTQQH